MIVDDRPPLALGQFVPCPTVGSRPLARLECGQQFGNRTGHIGLSVEPRLEDLGEDPLGPAVELNVGGGHRTPRVVAQADASQLAAHGGDVVLGCRAGMCARAHGELLGGQTKRVVTHGVQHIVAPGAAVTGVHVGGDVAKRMAHVQTRARGVGKHIEHIAARPIGHRFGIGQRPRRVWCLVGAVGLPAVLPAKLDLGGQLGGVSIRGERVCHAARLGEWPRTNEALATPSGSSPPGATREAAT